MIVRLPSSKFVTFAHLHFLVSSFYFATENSDPKSYPQHRRCSSATSSCQQSLNCQLPSFQTLYVAVADKTGYWRTLHGSAQPRCCIHDKLQETETLRHFTSLHLRCRSPQAMGSWCGILQEPRQPSSSIHTCASSDGSFKNCARQDYRHREAWQTTGYSWCSRRESRRWS